MRLLFDVKTRRFAGSIVGKSVGVPNELMEVVSPMPATPGTAFLSPDNVTVVDKPLTAAEIAAKPKPRPKLPITKLAFMCRFTDAELASVFAAAKADVSVEVWVEKLKACTEVGLEDTATVSGVNALETAGLLAVGRAAIILQ